MKYRHSFHAGNFADIHKHVTLLALLQALERKDKGFLYFETHAGRGAYELGESPDSRASRAGLERLIAAQPTSPELADLAAAVTAWRTERASVDAYPGSPLIAARRLRPQDRALLVERVREEALELEKLLRGRDRIRVCEGDGWELLRASLPPPERRGLTLIDPSYEDVREEPERVTRALLDALRRFATGVFLIWYPIKDARDTAAWLATLEPQLPRAALLCELWLHPRDSRVALNGSGLLIVNPPYGIAERMHEWMPQLQTLLAVGSGGGHHCRQFGPGVMSP